MKKMRQFLLRKIRRLTLIALGPTLVIVDLACPEMKTLNGVLIDRSFFIIHFIPVE